MIITNLCTSPTSTITLRANNWVPLTTVPSVRGMTYWVSFDMNVTGGTVSIIGTQGEFSARQRVSYMTYVDNSSPLSANYSVKSGSPTVTVTNILICTRAEYQANKTLLDGIGYFTGDTMPLA
jgi:hypothetical protein